MNRTRQLTGICDECEAPICFPADLVGTTGQCPHCGKQTVLFLAPPREDYSVPRKGKIWAIIAAVILIAGVAGPIVGLKKWEKRAAEQKAKIAARTAANVAAAAAQLGLSVSPIVLEKTPGGSTVQAAGTVRNITDSPRPGFRLEIAFLDRSGRKLGAAHVQKPGLEPREEWEFRTMVSEPKAASARLESVQPIK